MSLPSQNADNFKNSYHFFQSAPGVPACVALGAVGHPASRCRTQQPSANQILADQTTNLPSAYKDVSAMRIGEEAHGLRCKPQL
jgi:hypothetical protein